MSKSKTKIPEDIAALARKVGKQFKSEQNLADFSRLLLKITVETALGTEFDDLHWISVTLVRCD